MIFAARRKNHRWDLEALETATRAARRQAGAKLLEQLLAAPLEAAPEAPCHCGRRARQRGRRPKKMLTVLGEAEIERPYYLGGAGHQGQFPFDRELDVADTQYSPGVRRMMALVGSESSFEGGREQLRVLAGLEVTTKAAERGAEAGQEKGRPWRWSGLDLEPLPPVFRRRGGDDAEKTGLMTCNPANRETRASFLRP